MRLIRNVHGVLNRELQTINDVKNTELVLQHLDYVLVMPYRLQVCLMILGAGVPLPYNHISHLVALYLNCLSVDTCLPNAVYLPVDTCLPASLWLGLLGKALDIKRQASTGFCLSILQKTTSKIA